MYIHSRVVAGIGAGNLKALHSRAAAETGVGNFKAWGGPNLDENSFFLSVFLGMSELVTVLIDRWVAGAGGAGEFDFFLSETMKTSDSCLFCTSLACFKIEITSPSTVMSRSLK